RPAWPAASSVRPHDHRPRPPAAPRPTPRHFTAISNADDEFTGQRLRDCETIYALFNDHFRRKGFAVQEPGARLMVAIFDSQPGFNAYLGRKMSPLVTGIYHTDTNRLVTYSYAQNEPSLPTDRDSSDPATQLDCH